MDFYIISPPREAEHFNSRNLEQISDIIPVKYFQFRPKHSLISERFNFVKKNFNDFREVCLKKKIKMIINNDFEIAERLDFDGIHLGQKDKKCSDAKKKFGKKFLVGVSCSDSFSLYKKALEQNADYVAFGPVYETSSKRRKQINIDKLFISEGNLRLPFALIGGINHKNIKKCLSFNPDFIAMINSFWNFKDGPIKSALLFQKILKRKNEYEN